MHKFVAMLKMFCAYLNDWIFSPRALLSLLFLTILVLNFAQDFVQVVANNQLEAHWDEMLYLFLSLGFGNILVVSILFLIMISEIPRCSLYQELMLLRSSRLVWLLSHVLFCAAITALAILFLACLCMVIAAPTLIPGNGWSDLERITADADAVYRMMLTPEYVWDISPIQASLLAFIILFLFWFSMVLIVMFCTLADHPNLGIVIYAVLLLSRIIILWEMLTEFPLFMLADYATMMRIASKFPYQEFTALSWTIVGYCIIITLLICGMFLYISKADIKFQD